ncbi:MAG: hypothetical protein J7551_05650 [Chloroflexi bacterium]|nr:hypothetical protein [Chloroflexota bacterium]
MRSLTVVIAVIVLAAALGLTAYVAYTGFGAVRAGNVSVRSGSVGGVIVLGGGPGSGK